MRVLLSRRLLALLTALVAASMAVAVAIAATTSQQTINDTSNVHLRIVRTVADGFDSGWHVHPGIAVVQVQDGVFQIYQGSCTARTVGPGDTYIEVPHLPVRAVATGHIAWTTTMITNGGDLPLIPLSVYNPSSPNPCP
jgi:hypothetical protein